MCVVVNDSNSADLCQPLEPPHSAAEFIQPLHQRFNGYPRLISRRARRHCVIHIVYSGDVYHDMRKQLSLVHKVEFRA